MGDETEVSQRDKEYQDMVDELAMLKELRALKEQKRAQSSGSRVTLGVVSGAAETLAPQVSQPFNRGVFDTVAMPSRIINAATSIADNPTVQPAMTGLGMGGVTKALSYLPKIDVEGAQQYLADKGYLAQPGTEEQGIFPRSFEILGASVLPSAAILKHGGNAAKLGVPTQTLTPVEKFTSLSANNAGKASALDLVASFSAGTAGATAEKFTDDPALVMSAEIASGMIFPLTGLAYRLGADNYLKSISARLVPYTKAGADATASKALRSASGQPSVDAGKIDATSPIPPARQTENPRLMAIERSLIEADPKLQQQYSDDLKSTITTLRQQGSDFGGDTGKARNILQRGKDYLLNLVEARAAQKLEEAQIAIDKLDPSVSPRITSRIASEKLNQAHSEGREIETGLWGQVDGDLSIGYTNSRNEFKNIIDNESEVKLRHIPDWLINALGGKKLSNGRVIVQSKPQGTVEGRYKDLHANRTRLFHEMQVERRAAAPDAERLNLLQRIYGSSDENGNVTGMLADMVAADPKATRTALEFSREFNKKFTQGTVGKLLGFRGPEPEDMLASVLGGRSSTTQTRQFLKAAPEAKPEIHDYIKSQYIETVLGDGTFNSGAHKQFVKKYSQSGIFDEFPNLRDDIERVASLANRSNAMNTQMKIVQERGGSSQGHPHRQKQSLATLYLDADVGQEMNTVLQAKNPEKYAEALLRRMGGDQGAIQGLKSAFVESMMKASFRGEKREFSAQAFQNMVNDYKGVAKSLGMDTADMTRLNTTAQRLMQAQAKAPKAGEIVEGPLMLIDFMTTLAGAKVGQRVASGGMGSSIKMASAGASVAQKLMRKFNKGSAMDLLIAAQTDPVLYKALLMRADAAPQEVAKSINMIESWLIGVGTTQEERSRKWKGNSGNENQGVMEPLNLGNQ